MLQAFCDGVVRPPAGVLRQAAGVGAHEHGVALPVGQVAEAHQLGATEDIAQQQGYLAVGDGHARGDIDDAGDIAAPHRPHGGGHIVDVQVIAHLPARGEAGGLAAQQGADHGGHEAPLVFAGTIDVKIARPGQLQVELGGELRQDGANASLVAAYRVSGRVGEASER